MAAAQIYTEEDTRSLINTRSREPNGDNFRIKIHRRPSMGGLLVHVATMTDARAEHITYTETWLPKLCGGGSFALAIYPADSPNQMIGGFLNITFDGSIKPVNPMTIREPGWGGPAGLAFPDFIPNQQQVITQGAGGHSYSHVNAANVNVPGSGLPQSIQQPNEWERILSRERELQDRERKMREELLDERSRLREERLRAETQAQIAELRAQRVPVENNGPEKLLTAAAPIITQMMQMQSESRTMMMKMQSDTQALMIQMQRDAQARSDDTLKLMMARKDDGGSTAEMMGKMAEVMGAVSKTSVSMIEAVAEMQFQSAPSEHPGLVAIREFGKAIRAVSSGTQEGVRRAAAGRAALPSGNGVRPPASYEQQARTPAPPPAPPPAQPPAQPTSRLLTPVKAPPAAQASFGEMAQQSPQEQLPPSPLIGIAEAIKGYKHPTEVAGQFIHSLSNPQVQEAIEESDNSIKNLAVAMLGMDWIMSDERNEPYLKEIFDEINRLGTEAGIFDDDDDDDEDEGEAEGEEDADEREEGSA